MRRATVQSAGSPETLGVSVEDIGVNVAVFSAQADIVFFCLFDARGERELARFPLQRIGDVHCGFFADCGPGIRYGLRADGPYAPERGDWFDPAKLLVDPYARQLDRPFVLHPDLATPRSAGIDTAPLVPKAIVPPVAEPVAAAGARRPSPGFIYEVAVRAFTKKCPAVPLPLRGTVAALAHPAILDHLLKLSVDTVELMPVAAWIDERHLPHFGLTNAWGYNPVVFMAPDPRIAPGGPPELRATVSALHAAGIKVIVDAVYNHTGESDELGPTLSLRGLDNRTYYRHATDDPGRLINHTGTGNTLACDRAPVVRLVTDAMRSWVEATGIDGFRLDLATVLGRTESGFRPDAPLLAAIDADPILSRAMMIAEPWDIGPDGYRLGKFPAGWHEWNDRFRDDVRRFWRGDPGTLGSLATRIAGSADIFAGRAPSAGVNFVAAHDGFTLADLVAYAAKRNRPNGEDDRDGCAENFSWNNGADGPTDDAAIAAARHGDVRALLATLFVARGTPMLTAGDEFGRTQKGNNNAYAQDNPITWLNWRGIDCETLSFARELARFRRLHRSLAEDRFLTGQPVDASEIPDVTWLRPGNRLMAAEDWNALKTLGISLYVGASPTAPADRTVIWINGLAEAGKGWLPDTRPGFAWQLTLASSAPRPPTEIAALAEIELPPRSVQIIAEIEKTGAAGD